MSHFSRIKTSLVEKEYLVNALKDLGYQPEVGAVQVRGYGGNRTEVEVKIATGNTGYDIGFRKAGDSYEMVADWWGIHGISQEQLLQDLTQRYAYHASRAKLEQQGFELVTEETHEDGRIHLVLRRMV